MDRNYSPFHSSWKVTKLLHETEAKIDLATIEKLNNRHANKFFMIINSTSLTVRGQPSPRFHVEAWLTFGNCEMEY